ncbi:MAG: phenylacetate--CoA ligase family protein [bacterium]|nr:phenylacetate--CoA ligase family protein [bacterium]
MSEIPKLPRELPHHKLYHRLSPARRNRGVFADTWRFIMKSQRWSFDRMEGYVEKRLVEMVRHAARECPWYRQVFSDLGMDVEDFGCRLDLSLLPLIGRDELRDHVDEMVPDSQDRGELVFSATGGSSGIPVGFYRHKERTRAMESAFVTRFRTWAGASDTTREVICAGGVGDESERAQWAVDRRGNSLALASDDLNRLNFKWMLPLARKFKPRIFRGYPSAMAAFANLLLEAGETFPVEAVFTSSETLYDAQRKRIEEAFAAKVFDLYGHSERVIVAAECEKHEGYHVFSEYGLLEIVDENGSVIQEEGQVGEVVGTTLLHDYFPLIRYRTGDRAVYTARRCSCGRPFPLILRPDGRLQELLVTADDRRISMTSINRHDDLFAAVDQFQFHQREAGKAVLKVIPGPDYSDSERERIIASVTKHIGGDFALTIEVVESIEKTRIGKHRFLIQELEGI